MAINWLVINVTVYRYVPGGHTSHVWTFRSNREAMQHVAVFLETDDVFRVTVEEKEW